MDPGSAHSHRAGIGETSRICPVRELVQGTGWRYLAGMLAAIRIETVLVIMVVLNLIGMSIAAYVVMRKK